MKLRLESLDESEHKRQKLERENQDLVAELEKLSLIQVREHLSLDRILACDIHHGYKILNEAKHC